MGGETKEEADRGDTETGRQTESESHVLLNISPRVHFAEMSAPWSASFLYAFDKTIARVVFLFPRKPSAATGGKKRKKNTAQVKKVV